MQNVKIKKNTRARKFWKNLGDSDISNWELSRILYSDGRKCILERITKHKWRGKTWEEKGIY
jgi:hypothetical protein